MVLKFKCSGFTIDWCINVKNGRRQHACKATGLSRKLESSDEMIARGPFVEASAAKIKGGDAAAMEDLMSPQLTNKSCEECETRARQKIHIQTVLRLI